MDKIYVSKLVYVSNHIFFINNSTIGYTYDSLLDTINYESYKVELTMFMRKLKLLKLIYKSEKNLRNEVIYIAKIKPINCDYQFLYPHVMQSFNIAPDQLLSQYNNGPSYIRKTKIDETMNKMNKMLIDMYNDRKKLKNGSN